MFARVNQQHAVNCQPVARQFHQPGLDVVRQRGTADVEPQLDGGGHLVDILTARTGRAHELLVDLTLVDGQTGGDAKHFYPPTRNEMPNQKRASCSNSSTSTTSKTTAGRSSCTRKLVLLLNA